MDFNIVRQCYISVLTGRSSISKLIDWHDMGRKIEVLCNGYSDASDIHAIYADQLKKYLIR